ncbi:hypothetical protein FBU31_003986, partial [Coemansia sp. 'formosensis']
MSRRVTNFDQEFFSKDSGFQSVHARTLPGRTMEYQGWFESSQWPRYQMPLAYNTYTGQPHAAVKPQQRGYYPTIFSDTFFKPPTEEKPVAAKPPPAPVVPVVPVVPSPAQIKDHSDRRELTITSELFKEAKPSVQLKGRELRVHAAKVVTGS